MDNEEFNQILSFDDDQFLEYLAHRIGEAVEATGFGAVTRSNESYEMTCWPEEAGNRIAELRDEQDFRKHLDHAWHSKRLVVFDRQLSSVVEGGEYELPDAPQNDWQSDACSLFLLPVARDDERESIVLIEKTVDSDKEKHRIALRISELGVLSALRQQEALMISETQKLEEFYTDKVAELDSQLSETRTHAEQANASQVVSSRIGQTLDKEKSAFCLANELRSFFDAERITILDRVGEKYSVLAVSGQPTVNKRANIVRATQEMIGTIGLSDDPIYFDGDFESFASSTHSGLQSYLDESFVTNFAALPLHRSKEQIYESERQSLVEVVVPGRTHDRTQTGAVLVEYMTTPMDQGVVSERWNTVSQSVQNQHSNAKEYSELIFLPFQKVLTKFAALYRGHTKRIALLITFAILIPLVLALIVPATFRVRCEGVLRPENQRLIFAPEESKVSQLLVKEGQAVKKGQLIIELTNLEIERQLAELNGNLEVLKAQQKVNVHKRSVFIRGNSQEIKQRQAELASVSIDLEIQIEAAKRNLAVLQRRADNLKICAPFNGTISGWNIDRKLLDRPVQPGVQLFAISPDNANWILELKVPDKRAGYVQNAVAEAGEEDLRAEFSIASQPEKVHWARVSHVNPGLEEDTDLSYVLPVEAIPDSKLDASLRSGTPVVAKVGCGTRSFLYCKTYEFVDRFNRGWFEYFY